MNIQPRENCSWSKLNLEELGAIELVHSISSKYETFTVLFRL